MVVALGAHSFAPITPPAHHQGAGLASSPGFPGGQRAPGATGTSEAWDPVTQGWEAEKPWVPPWTTPEQAKEQAAARSEIFLATPKERQIESLFPLAPVKVDYVSPSAIETIDLCERKWAFVKLDRLEKGGSAAAELGTATHTQHERWFLEGTPYDLTTRAGELALATHDLLPPRETPGLRVEQEMRFAWPSIPGGVLGGKIDLNWRHSAWPSGGQTHFVLDHKTSSNVEQYGKLTREALLHHPQAPVYGAFGIWFSVPGQPPADEVELRWNYVNTKGKPKGTPSWHVLRPDEIHAAVEQYVAPGARRLLAIVEQANATRSSGTPFGAKDLPFPDPGKRACSAFGGCPFKSVCGITPARSLAIMSDPSQDFLARMGLAPQPLAQAPTAPPQTFQPPAPAPVAPAPAAPVLPLAPAVQNLAVPPVGYGHSAPPAPQMGYGGQVNPPEGQLPPPAPVAPPPMSPADAGAAHVATAESGKRKRRTKAEIEAERNATASQAAGLLGVPFNSDVTYIDAPAGSSFVEQAALAVLPNVTAGLMPQIMQGAVQPFAVAILSATIAKAVAKELGIEGA